MAVCILQKKLQSQNDLCHSSFTPVCDKNWNNNKEATPKRPDLEAPCQKRLSVKTMVWLNEPRSRGF